MNNKAEQYNLKSFLNKYKVEIPILQRDYVQGRIGEENVRNSFLFKLYEFLTNNYNKTLNLDFIFGYQENNIFFPIDGQQHITTLWLLHIYLYGKKINMSVDEKNYIQKILRNFSYTTRRISASICQLFVGEIINYENQPELVLADRVIYRGEATLDPTVKSMVKMLNAIHEKFNNINNIDMVLERLDYIVFNVIDMEQYKLGESLYIKLNGRGKQLSTYENFKAWIMEDSAIRNEYASCLNTFWIDKFWDTKHNTDISLMKFINICTIYFKYNDGFSKENINFYLKDEVTKNLDKSQYLKINHQYPNDHLFTVERIELMNRAISFISEINFIDLHKLKEIDVFVVLSYLEYNKSTDCEKFNDYYGVITRIYNNVRLEYESDLLYNILGLIKDWKIFSQDIILELSKIEYKRNKQGNFEDNKKEEITKAKLIQTSRINGDEWEAAINEAHKHNYFNGRIMFLLNYSKQNSEYLLEEFKSYYEVASKIFEHDFFSQHLNLIQRSILYIYDYTWYNSHYNLGTNKDDIRNKNPLYNYVFNYEENKKYPFKMYLDKVREQLENNDNISECLKKVISNNNKFKNFNGDWWRYLIVKYSAIMKQSQNKKFYFDDNDMPVWILSKTRMSSIRWNLLTYGLYIFINKYIKKNKCDNIEVSEYEPNDPANNRKCRFSIETQSDTQYEIYHNANTNDITIKQGRVKKLFQYNSTKNIYNFYRNICKDCGIIE